MNRKLIYFIGVLLSAIIIIVFVAIPLELIIALFSWQPLAGRILIYGLILVFVFVKGYEEDFYFLE